VLALDANVTRQAAEPFWSKATPQNDADEHGDCADEDEKFTEIPHGCGKLR
jgi:hypothetical protein